MPSDDPLLLEVVHVFLKRHGDEVRRVARGDILLEAGLARLEEIDAKRKGELNDGSPE